MDTQGDPSERAPMIKKVGTKLKNDVEEEMAMYQDKNEGNDSDNDSE